MVKIVGISLVTFMVVMVFITYFSFQDKEDAYDAVRIERTSRLAIEKNYPVEDLAYLVSYDAVSGKIEVLSGKPDAIDYSDTEPEFASAVIYERIRNLNQTEWKSGLEEILKNSPEEFQGYAGFIRSLAVTAPSAQAVLALVDKDSQQFTYRSIKIRELPDKDFRKLLTAYNDKLPPKLASFAEAIRRYLASHPDMDGAKLKQEVLHFFSPFHPETTRRYRSDAANHHYTAFMKFDHQHKILYEAGYRYIDYRRFIQPVGVRLTLVFITVVLTIIFGFRLFFLGTLVRPLQALLSGVRKVNKGNLAVHVPVGVADEIGFLTESFNGMVSSIRIAREKLERHADELEVKVRERTAELTETLQTVQDLKSQQDGDYFLTSLLIKPLARNTARSETVHVEFLMEQKKKFEFRKWKEEIGGDFCSAHTVELAGKRYTVLVNADAMGKSIQGAGGALVLGAVFESIMERTRSIPSFRDQSPERWLKNAFQELHGIFESFDGSMLVSMVLGLLDDESGLLYYVNVEHPWTVLYRGGKASFIETEHQFRKLGVAGVEGQIRVQTFQMEPDDVLILGSDGRDDILLGTSESGERIINEDEHLFLKMVEAAQGRLPEIRSHLEEQGPLTDDLSLIRVAYRSHEEDQAPDREEAMTAYREKARQLMEENKFAEAAVALGDALQLDPRSLKTIRMMVRLFLDQKDYDRAFAQVEDYIYLRPLDTDMIYLASYLCKKLKKLRDAAEFGERVRLRAPDMVRNLLNLSEVYARLGNKDRSAKILREVYKLEPDNKKADKLRKLLETAA
jgi:HAMP domain-containing protein/TolA-binding protein